MPTPKPKRGKPDFSSASAATLAVAWASTAGWMRSVGQVTAVYIRRSVTCAIAPRMVQTKGELPCSLFQG